jgi:hypothetical protein
LICGYPCTLKSYSSVKDVHGALEKPSGALLAHPGASEVPAGALEAYSNNSEADSGVCGYIYCYYEPPSLNASRVNLHISRVILYSSRRSLHGSMVSLHCSRMSLHSSRVRIYVKIHNDFFKILPHPCKGRQDIYICPYQKSTLGI